MAVNKRFKNVEEKLDWGTVQYFTYNDEKITDDEIENLVNQLLEQNEQLKAQLYYDGDSVCNICKHQYLVESEKYYVAKCGKGHEKCSKNRCKIL